MRNLSAVLLLCLSNCLLFAQDADVPVAIGEWKAYLPYNGPVSISLSEDRVYAATGLSVFSYVFADKSFERLHKANGLNDIDAIGVFCGISQGALAITYLNSNMDFIIDGEVVNFPYIRSSTFNGNKSIHSVSFAGDSAFIATAFGIVVYDISEKESPATYFFTDPLTSSPISVNQVLVENGNIYAATDNGLYRGDRNEPLLEDFSKWEMVSGTDGLPTGACTWPIVWNGNIYVVTDGEFMYQWDGSDWILFYAETDWNIRHMSTDGSGAQLLLVQGTDILPEAFRMIDLSEDGSAFELPETSNLSAPEQIFKKDNAYWIADAYGGLALFEDGVYTVNTPNGPLSSGMADMEHYDGKLWVTAGAINASWNYTYNQAGFAVLDFGYWTNYNYFNYPELSNVLDFITMTLDARTGVAWLGSYGGGVVSLDRATGELDIYDQTNTGPEGLQEVLADSGSCRIGGMQFDVNGNLWVANYGATNPLVVRRADGSWQNFNCNLPNDIGNKAGQIVIDDFDQVWMQIPRGSGILVYNHGPDIGNTADDESRLLGIGAGNGNLPVAFVNCLLKDKDGEIWVGTNEGVAIFYNPGSIMDGGTIADASQPLVNLGGFNEFLLSKEIVNCMAVDGANRKWIGTNSGVFLISADGTRQLRFFNQDNSPLLSNVIVSITIDAVSGEVFFGTEKGIVSYRGTATEGLATHGDVKVFPNPVRPEYTGLIAISGLVNNAQVKITDTGGRLIYETTALGGQAIWNGKGYNGNPAASGVYMVYSADDTGKETAVAKIVVIR